MAKALFCVALAASAGCATTAAKQAAFSVPAQSHTLANGLKVVLSPDHTAPTATVALYYNIGFRLEPKGRTGFAHLFEHLMFQGSKNLGKLEYIKLVQASGGVLNGSTRLDYTNFYATVPAAALERTLWAEADRMKGLQITAENLKNQQDVVKNEVRVNVLNRPYGGFPWLWMPQVANSRWENAHNFYGDLTDIDAATLEDASAFFSAWYRPGNAALAVVGDFEPAEALAWVHKYFDGVEAGPTPKLPDVTEPRQEAERRQVRVDALAQRPALAFAYHLPPPETPEYLAMLMVDFLLANGRDSALHEALVQKHGFTAGVSSAIHQLGTPFNVEGPETWQVWLIHDPDKTPDEILAASEVEIGKLRDAPVDAAAFARARTKARSWLYDLFEAGNGFGRADLLASYALFRGAPEKVNDLEARLLAVTPELLQKTARDYLRPEARTVLVWQAGAGKGGAK